MNQNFTRTVQRLMEHARDYNSLGDDPICHHYGISPYSEQSNKRYERQLLQIIEEGGFADATHLWQEAKWRGVSARWFHFHVDIILPYYERVEEVVPDPDWADPKLTVIESFELAMGMDYIPELCEVCGGAAHDGACHKMEV